MTSRFIFALFLVFIVYAHSSFHSKGKKISLSSAEYSLRLKRESGNKPFRKLILQGLEYLNELVDKEKQNLRRSRRRRLSDLGESRKVLIILLEGLYPYDWSMVIDDIIKNASHKTRKKITSLYTKICRFSGFYEIDSLDDFTKAEHLYGWKGLESMISAGESSEQELLAAARILDQLLEWLVDDIKRYTNHETVWLIDAISLGVVKIINFLE